MVLVEDIPKVCHNDSDYLKSSIQRQACTISAVDSRTERKALSAIYSSIKEEKNVTILDPHDRLCEQADGGLRCSNWLGSQLLYLDSSPHLTYWASSSLASFFVDELRPFFVTNQ
ncbi:SGNH hydrolase domain-containing protein [Ferrigenium sp. UT5]|uniref:SGNH hydrolase domain-containing protein n=1 Tax=Ferrigenium sp. UT5 TaxID=3242105 RepID=UPI0038B35069